MQLGPGKGFQWPRMTFCESCMVPGSRDRLDREGREELGGVLAAWSAVQVRAVGEERMCRKGGRGAQVPRTGMESNFSLYSPT